MKIEDINIDETIEKAKCLLVEEKNISPALRTIIEILLSLVSLLVGRLNVNSSNSSKPPSMDPNRPKQKKEGKGKKPGAQEGHRLWRQQDFRKSRKSG